MVPRGPGWPNAGVAWPRVRAVRREWGDGIVIIPLFLGRVV
jgi:hypothetical protein